MDRFGIFVDVGRLFSGAGALCLGVPERNRLALDSGALLRTLADAAAADCELPPLRTYWYDAAPDAVPTPEHLAIAGHSGVKLRLGRLVGNPPRQKGVDSKIVRDLIILSQHRAISAAYLLGGDEDLSEGVVEAQELGVRVVLFAIGHGPGLARTLAMAADEVIVLDRDVVSPLISLRGSATPETGEAIGGSHRLDGIGREFGIAWGGGRTRGELERLGHPGSSLPGSIDRALLLHASDRLGRRHLDEGDRAALRQGFWEVVRTLLGEG